MITIIKSLCSLSLLLFLAGCPTDNNDLDEILHTEIITVEEVIDSIEKDENEEKIENEVDKPDEPELELENDVIADPNRDFFDRLQNLIRDLEECDYSCPC